MTALVPIAGGVDQYDLLPFRFARLPGAPENILVTSEAGEFAFVSPDDLSALAQGRSLPEQTADRLEAVQIIRRGGSDLPVRLLATKLRTRKSFLRGGPKLHIFVVTLRCDHSCRYCQVSRASDQSDRYDMDNPVDLGENELERLGDAQDAFRDLAARMRAFALNEGFAVRLVSWRYDSMAASTALLAVSHTLHSYGADRASAKSKLEEILRFKTVAS